MAGRDRGRSTVLASAGSVESELATVSGVAADNMVEDCSPKVAFRMLGDGVALATPKLDGVNDSALC